MMLLTSNQARKQERLGGRLHKATYLQKHYHNIFQLIFLVKQQNFTKPWGFLLSQWLSFIFSAYSFIATTIKIYSEVIRTKAKLTHYKNLLRSIVYLQCPVERASLCSLHIIALKSVGQFRYCYKICSCQLREFRFVLYR